MAANQSPGSGSSVNMDTWIERGNRGNWFTGNGATGDVAHLEINHYPGVEERWVREYAAGRKAFQEPRIEAARLFTKQGKPAEAVTSARIAKEIPWRGRAFMRRQGVVVEAMRSEEYVDEGFRAGLDEMSVAMQEAFETPYEIKQELEGIMAEGRENIKGKEVEAWTAAANFFGESGDLNAAGVAAVELGAAYEQKAQTEDALKAFVSASNVIKHRLGIVDSQGDSSRHTAEVDVLSDHLVKAQLGVLRIIQQQTPKKVKGVYKEFLKAAVYDLDDRAASQTVMEGYRLLARSSHLRERRFYKREATGIAGNLAVAAFFENNPGSIFVGRIVSRTDRRRLRPPVKLPAAL